MKLKQASFVTMLILFICSFVCITYSNAISISASDAKIVGSPGSETTVGTRVIDSNDNVLSSSWSHYTPSAVYVSLTVDVSGVGYIGGSVSSSLGSTTVSGITVGTVSEDADENPTYVPASHTITVAETYSTHPAVNLSSALWLKDGVVGGDWNWNGSGSATITGVGWFSNSTGTISFPPQVGMSSGGQWDTTTSQPVTVTSGNGDWHVRLNDSTVTICTQVTCDDRVNTEDEHYIPCPTTTCGKYWKCQPEKEVHAEWPCIGCGISYRICDNSFHVFEESCSTDTNCISTDFWKCLHTHDYGRTTTDNTPNCSGCTSDCSSPCSCTDSGTCGGTVTDNTPNCDDCTDGCSSCQQLCGASSWTGCTIMSSGGTACYVLKCGQGCGNDYWTCSSSGVAYHAPTKECRRFGCDNSWSNCQKAAPNCNVASGKCWAQ